MRSSMASAAAFLLAILATGPGGVLPAAEGGFVIPTPGLAPSRVDARGGLAEDWGTVTVALDGEPLAAGGRPEIEEIRIEGIVPAIRAVARKGEVRAELTAYRAPAWPAGIDVLSIRLEETAGREAGTVLSIDLPPGARIGARGVNVGGRTVLTLPPRPRAQGKLREWGYCDEATSLPGWARPEGECDPAFRNIRAGLGGVPIAYRFQVSPRSAANVVLGFCESHWATAGQRPVVCAVEGAERQEVDPIARWGRHKPGVLAFAARDANGDGYVEVGVLPKPGAPDLNPILNAIWIFPPGPLPDLAAVTAGKLSAVALRHVQVGGEKDQPIDPAEKIEYSVKLAPRGSETLEFLVAVPGGSAPLGDCTAWTLDGLRAAAKAVWTDWKAR